LALTVPSAFAEACFAVDVLLVLSLLVFIGVQV
jgi:hypothetical protein